MRLILGLLVVGALTLLGARLSFGRFGRGMGKGQAASHPAVRYFLWSGGAYVAAGVLLGPGVLGVLNGQILDDLRPLVVLGLGWIGFLLGLRFRWEDVAALPSRVLVSGLGQGILAFGGLFALVWMALGWVAPFLMPGDNGTLRLAATWMLTVVGAASSQTLVGLLTKEHLLTEGPVGEWLRQVAALDTLVPLLGMGVLVTMEPFLAGRFNVVADVVGPTHTAWRLVETPVWLPWLWPIISVGLGGAMGGIFHWVLAEEPPREALLVVTIGMIALGAGGAFYLGLSPLFSNFVMGLTFANLSRHNHRVMGLISHWERLMYIVFLILAGAIWAGQGILMALAVLVPYLALRLASKLGGVFVLIRATGQTHLPPGAGAGLMGQGGLAVAVAVAMTLQNPGWAPPWVLGVCLMGLMVNDLASPWLIPFWLKGGKKT